MNQSIFPKDDLSWPASIDCEFHLASTGRTELAKLNHLGPLRVQRLFHDESLAHCYLLHPPGGMVSGDNLKTRIQLHPDSRALVTTPSSGKFYKARSNGSLQTTCTSIVMGPRTYFAYLPQDTIVFNGASGVLQNEINLPSTASYFGWEHIVLGRLAGDHKFESGQLTQIFSIIRDGKLLYQDRFEMTPEILQSIAGLNGSTSYAVAFLVLPESFSEQESLISVLRELVSQFSGFAGVSAVRASLICIRLIGDRAEDTRLILESLWSEVGSVMLGRVVMQPRIWRT